LGSAGVVARRARVSVSVHVVVGVVVVVVDAVVRDPITVVVDLVARFLGIGVNPDLLTWGAVSPVTTGDSTARPGA